MKMRELGHVFLEKEVENGTFFGAEMGLFTGGNRGNREDTDYHELNTNFLTTDGHGWTRIFNRRQRRKQRWNHCGQRRRRDIIVEILSPRYPSSVRSGIVGKHGTRIAEQDEA